MSDPPPDLPGGPPPARRGPLFYVGSAALLGAMGVDVAAVVGRHAGFSVLGSIEIVKAAMLLSSSAALVAASLAGKHATVHLLVNRLRAGAQDWLERCNALLTALFFLALAAGCAWIAIDLRDGHESSEVLRIPYAPLRVVGVAAMLGLVTIALTRLRRKAA